MVTKKYGHIHKNKIQKNRVSPLSEPLQLTIKQLKWITIAIKPHTSLTYY